MAALSLSPSDTVLSTMLELALRSLAAIVAQGGEHGNGLTLWLSESPWAEPAFRAIAKERGLELQSSVSEDAIYLLDSASLKTIATLYMGKP